MSGAGAQRVRERRPRPSGPDRRFCRALAALAFLLSAARSADAAAQQASAGWSEPANLSRSSTESVTPSLAADPSGVVHVIWSETSAEGQSGLLYSSGLEASWAAPLEVVLTPGGGPSTHPALFADSRGMLHLSWLGGGTVYYSRAYAPSAGSAWGWARPQALVEPRNYLGAPDLDMSSSGTLWMAYAQQLGDDKGVYLLRSDDGGQHWSSPAPAYVDRRSGRMVSGARIALDPDGTLHVAWVESNYPETFPPQGIWYASSHDGGDTWGEPAALAQGPYDDPEIAVPGHGEVHVVWSGTAGDRFKFHRWSRDGGLSWSEIWRDQAMGGLQGSAALPVDSDGHLHWIKVGTLFGMPQPGVYADRLFEQEWLGSRWTAAETVMTSTVPDQNMNFVSSAVSLGNEIYVALHVPVPAPDGWQFDILVTHRTVAARGIPAQALVAPETQTADASVTSDAPPLGGEAATAVPAPTEAPRSLPREAQQPVLSGVWQPLLLGISAVAVVCAAAVAAATLRRR